MRKPRNWRKRLSECWALAFEAQQLIAEVDTKQNGFPAEEQVARLKKLVAEIDAHPGSKI